MTLFTAMETRPCKQAYTASTLTLHAAGNTSARSATELKPRALMLPVPMVRHRLIQLSFIEISFFERVMTACCP